MSEVWPLGLIRLFSTKRSLLMYFDKLAGLRSFEEHDVK